MEGKTCENAFVSVDNGLNAQLIIENDYISQTKEYSLSTDLTIPVQQLTVSTIEESSYEMVFLDLETTGFPTYSEVIQIAALYGENTFNAYILPHYIPEQVTALTGLEIVDNTLVLHGKQVPTVSKQDAWNGLRMFLFEIKKKVFVLAHGIAFDLRFLVKETEECGLLENFQELLHSCVDTITVCKEAFPGRKSYKQTSIAADMKLSFGPAHNALSDVLTLQAIINHVPVIVVEKHAFGLKSWCLKMAEEKSLKRRKETLLPLKGEGISAQIIGKIATAGITMEKIISTYKSAGENGIKDLLQDIGSMGKPRVTKNPKIIHTILEYLERNVLLEWP